MATKPEKELRVVDGLPPLLERAYKGEVFADDGFRLDPIVMGYLKSLKGQGNDRKSLIYSPSQLAKCSRALYYNRIGVKQLPNTDEKLQLIFSVGHAVQAVIDGILAGAENSGFFEKAGLQLLPAVDMRVEAYALAGEADYLLVQRNDHGQVERIIDLKTISKDSFANIRQVQILKDGKVVPAAMKSYVWQLHSYMVGFGAPRATLYYICKDNSERKEVPFTFSLPLWETIEEKIFTVEEHVLREVPPEREVSSYICPGCPFFHECRPEGVKG